MSYIYQLNETITENKNGISSTAYGIDAVTKKGKIKASFVNIFRDRKEAEKFVALCNECELSLIHLANVVEDALYEQLVAH